MESLNSNSQKRELHQLQQMQDKEKESCMVSFQLLHSHLKALSNNDLKGTYIEGGFEREFTTLLDQDFQSFTGSMFLNLDQLGKQLDKEEFHEIRSFGAFRVLMTQFQTFIDFRYCFDNDEGLMIRSQFWKEQSINERKTESNETESERHVLSSRSRNDTHTDDADINYVNDKQPMAEVQLSVEHNILANEQQHSEQSNSVDDTYLLEKTIAQLQKDLSRMETHCINMELKYQNQALKDGQHGQILNETSNEANIKREINVLEARNIDLESSVARLLAENTMLNKENEHLKQTYKDLFDSIKKISVQTKDHADSLIVQLNYKTVENADLKAQIQKKVFANAELKNELRKSKGNSVDTKFAKPSILGKPVLQPPKNQSVVRQPNMFKSERPNFSKPQFASQVDVNNVLSKPVTPRYFPKVRESAHAKPHHVNAPSSSRNGKKESYGSNDMAHNYYLEKAKKKTQDKNRNLKPRKMPFAKTHHTPNACTPKPRSNNQTSRNWLAFKSCEETLKAVQKSDHSRNRIESA
nr:hypothetical protein [Tanacetum cinerariifolium]